MRTYYYISLPLSPPRFLVSRLYVSRSLPSVYEHSKCKHITLTDSLTANKANIICSPINFCYIYSHSRRWAAARVMPFLTNKQGSRSHKNSINKRNIDKEEARPKKKKEWRERERQNVAHRRKGKKSKEGILLLLWHGNRFCRHKNEFSINETFLRAAITAKATTWQQWERQ